MNKKTDNKELIKALSNVLSMFQYPESYGMRLYYAMDGTKIREDTIKAAEAVLKQAEGEQE